MFLLILPGVSWRRVVQAGHYPHKQIGVKSRNLINATKEANGIILLRLGKTETKRKGETVASQMKKLHRFLIKKPAEILDFVECQAASIEVLR